MIITAAGRSMGRAIALDPAREGCNILVSSTNE